MSTTELPYVDEHGIEIAADADRVWAALCESVDRTFSRSVFAAYARLIRCDPCVASGARPLVEGSTMPGFRVSTATRGVELVLTGRHAFSVYALIFTLEVSGSGTRLRAESRASFPGLAGKAYRLMVIGTRGHVAGVRSLLSSVRDRAVA